jgi:ABC-type branched-subunit amino acid transport system substrate-binding protein
MTTTATSGSQGDSDDGSPRRPGPTALRRRSAGRRARSLAAGGLVVGLVLAMTACSRNSSSAGSGASSTSTGSGTSSGAPFNGVFGSLKTPVCGPMPTPTPTPTKAQVGATSGINVKGVTASNIRVGTISDTGYVGSPGLNQELWDASDVFVDWCNSLGGINGHKIQLDKLDSKITQYKQVVQTACTQDFALVGGGAVFDNTAETDRLKCLLPNYPGFLVTAEARGSDLSVQASNADTNSAVNFGIARYLSTTFPSSSSAVGYLAPNLASLTTLKNQFKEAGAHFGWKTAYDQSYNALGEASWVPFAQSLKTKGVKGLLWTGEPDALGKLVAALGQVNYKMAWIAAVSNAAEPQLISAAGDSIKLNNVYVQDPFTPFLATDVPAINQYEQLFQKYLPHGRNKAALGLSSFSAWLLFAQAAKACGATITRLCVYDNASHTKSWNGAGLTGQVNPSLTEVPTACFVPLKVDGSGVSMINWQANDGPYNCDPRNVVPLRGNYGAATKLSAVGKSMADLN